MNTINTIALTLLEAQLTLYLQRADGSLGAAVWSGADAENFRQGERWLNVETKPSGARYPRQHPLVAQYELAIERVWALPLTQLAGFQATEQTYVLDVVWTDEEGGAWQRRTYYGVTISARTLASKDIESGHADNQEFMAQYFVVGSGGVGQLQPPVQAVPQYVVLRGTDSIATLIYTYAAGVFTVVAGATGATIAADGSSMQFGSDAPALVTSATGVTIPALHDFLPVNLPRLEFYYGPTLLAVLTPDGFWAVSLTTGTLPGAAAGQFVLQYSGSPVAVLAPSGTTALNFTD